MVVFSQLRKITVMCVVLFSRMTVRGMEALPKSSLQSKRMRRGLALKANVPQFPRFLWADWDGAYALL